MTMCANGVSSGFIRPCIRPYRRHDANLVDRVGITVAAANRTPSRMPPVINFLHASCAKCVNLIAANEER